MSAAVMPAAQNPQPEAVQLSLVPSALTQLLEVAVWGRLTRHGQLRTSTDGSPHLVVEVLQPPGRMPFVAIRHGRHDQHAEFAHLLEGLKPGTAIVIRCRGIEIGRHEGHDVLRPAICDAICVANFSPFNPEIAP